MGAKKENIEVDILAFADDLAMVTENEEIAQIYIEKLQELTSKTGLQISYDKTMYMSNHIKNNKS